MKDFLIRQIRRSIYRPASASQSIHCYLLFVQLNTVLFAMLINAVVFVSCWFSYCIVIRYRGLKNFRTAEWDPREGLPDEYSRIFEFENFGRTRQRVLKEAASSAAASVCASGRSSRRSSTGPAGSSSAMEVEPPAEAIPGDYICIHVKGVSRRDFGELWLKLLLLRFFIF